MGKQISSNQRCNEQIRITPIRLIGENNEQLGIIPTHEALTRAREVGLDLVEVSPHDRPPVCKIMDYGKFKYNQKKHQKSHHEQQLKELRLRPKTDQHDLDVRINQCFRFLQEGDKVQFTLVFKGRERSHPEVAFATFKEIQARLAEGIKVERPPSMEGRMMVMILSPNKPGLDKMAQTGGPKPAAKIAAPPPVAGAPAPKTGTAPAAPSVVAPANVPMTAAPPPSA